MRYVICCTKCSKLMDLECKDAEKEAKTSEARCPDCGGEMRRGLSPTPMIGDRVKGRMGNY